MSSSHSSSSQRVSLLSGTRRLLDVMEPGGGYEAYQLARRLNMSTAQVHLLIEQLLASRELIMTRNGKGNVCGHARTYFYRSGDEDGNGESNALLRVKAKHRVRELRADDVLAVMKPGVGYLPVQLARLLGVVVRRIHVLMPALRDSGRVIFREGRNYENGTRVYLANAISGTTTSAAPTDSVARPTHAATADVRKSAWDMEYGRSLVALRVLCESTRGQR